MKKAFTLIELVMVIVILGILAAVAIPQYVNLTAQATRAAAQGAVGAVRSAVAIEYANRAVAGNPTFPPTIAGTMFSDGTVPTNPLAPAANTVVTTYNGAGGWVYTAATGTVASNDAANTTL